MATIQITSQPSPQRVANRKVISTPAKKGGKAKPAVHAPQPTKRSNKPATSPKSPKADVKAYYAEVSRRVAAERSAPGRLDAYRSARILDWINVGETVGPKTLTVLIEHLERLMQFENLRQPEEDRRPKEIPVLQSMKQVVRLYSAKPATLDADTWKRMICAYIAQEFTLSATHSFEGCNQEAMWEECKEAAERDFMSDSLETGFAA